METRYHHGRDGREKTHYRRAHAPAYGNADAKHDDREASRVPERVRASAAILTASMTSSCCVSTAPNQSIIWILRGIAGAALSRAQSEEATLLDCVRRVSLTCASCKETFRSHCIFRVHGMLFIGCNLASVRVALERRRESLVVHLG